MSSNNVLWNSEFKIYTVKNLILSVYDSVIHGFFPLILLSACSLLSLYKYSWLLYIDLIFYKFP